ncbi:MAG: isoaspartyl peptidase/L-asparaginase [Bacteroidia bacterium]
MKKTAIAIHGGAGTILRNRMTPEKEKKYKAGLREALILGNELLEKGGKALDVVEEVVKVLENNPLYNAGKGAVFAADGTHLLDASMMCGDTLKAGAIAGVRRVKNPITLARAVMDQSAYVMMVGEGAEAFAKKQGITFESEDYFFDQLRYDQWQRVKDTPMTILDHTDKGEKNFSTVGAVALDQYGNLAAATSTGGMTNKQFGRVGDTPIIGSGCYAENATCAVCCTGHGEPFIRSVVAFDVSRLMAYKGLSLEEAAKEVVMKKLVERDGEGGLIAVDREGNISLTFNCEGMYRGSMVSGGEVYVAIYGDE